VRRRTTQQARQTAGGVNVDIDWTITLAGLFVGFVVGLTGMGGGALMTPMLVLFFGIQPLAAVSSDLVASLFMKPVGGAVHLRHGTVNKALVGWLCLGSVPAAFAGVLVLRAFGDGDRVESIVKVALGIALLVAAATMIAKAYVDMRRRIRHGARVVAPITVRPVPTVLIGVLGGFVVGMTSVGSGSLIIVCLLLIYPTLKANQLVGTDLVQAVPLVGAAALGHLLFGDVEFGLTASLIIGALPGVYLGARASASAPQSVIRRALAIVLTASALKLLGVDTVTLGWLVLAMVVVAPLVWIVLRRRAEARRPPRQAGTDPVATDETTDAAGPSGPGDAPRPASTATQG
jgi:uncharacterized protein